jgi:CRP-like cAMP-binding protein
MSGRVCMFKRSDMTVFKDLGEDDYFGDIGFFSEVERTVSARTLDFTDVMFIKQEDFVLIAQ